MKILITGANGYLGRGIVTELLNQGHEVIATDISTVGIDERAVVEEQDLFKLDDPYCFFGKPDIVLHMAWRDGFSHYSDAHINDLYYHYSFVKKMMESGIGKVVTMGSMHEIGFYEGCIKETTNCKPITPYGIAKNALRELSEMVAKQTCTRLQWLRGYYIVGNSIEGNSIFSKMVQAVNEGKKEFPFTMGQNQYDFIDYDEFCHQVACTVEQDNINGVINICSGKPQKLAERVEQFISENNFDIKLQYGAFPDRPYDSKAIWADNTKIRKILKNVK